MTEKTKKIIMTEEEFMNFEKQVAEDNGIVDGTVVDEYIDAADKAGDIEDFTTEPTEPLEAVQNEDDKILGEDAGTAENGPTELVVHGRLAEHGDLCYCTDGYINPKTGKLYSHLCKYLKYPLVNEYPKITCLLNKKTLIRHEYQTPGVLDRRPDVWVPVCSTGCPNSKSSPMKMAFLREDNVTYPVQKDVSDE